MIVYVGNLKESMKNLLDLIKSCQNYRCNINIQKHCIFIYCKKNLENEMKEILFIFAVT